jgi:hypothetical protein
MRARIIVQLSDAQRICAATHDSAHSGLSLRSSLRTSRATTDLRAGLRIAGQRREQTRRYTPAISNFSNAYLGYLDVLRWGIKRVIKHTIDAVAAFCVTLLLGRARIEVFTLESTPLASISDEAQKLTRPAPQSVAPLEI